MRLTGLILLGAVGLPACSPSATTGADRASGSTATAITWSDGQPAYSIACSLPGGCQQRALALCNQGQYTTLKSENMPIAGSARYDRGGPPSVVIRCG